MIQTTIPEVTSHRGHDISIAGVARDNLSNPLVRWICWDCQEYWGPTMLDFALSRWKFEYLNTLKNIQDRYRQILAEEKNETPV